MCFVRAEIWRKDGSCLRLYTGTQKIDFSSFLAASQDASVVLGTISKFSPYVYAASSDLEPSFLLGFMKF